MITDCPATLQVPSPLCCILRLGHTGWHYDPLYDRWAPIAAIFKSDPVVAMQKKWAVDAYNMATHPNAAALGTFLGAEES